jgi:NAD(P)-dependent dehydrogenase (short-subunit alcohol dehydrogenase family)
MQKVILITGATSGIGLATARLLAKAGHQLWLLNRNPEKTQAVVAEIRKSNPSADLHTIQLDLNQLDSVYAAATQLQSLNRIDVLINNAGGLTDKYYRTKDGFEQQFQQNHLGHFVLTTALLPLLIKSKARIVNVSSMAHKVAQFDVENLQGEKSYHPFRQYALVKLLNILFTRALHQRYSGQGLTAYALHPGVVNTGFGEGLGAQAWLWRLVSPWLITPEKGAATSVYLATQPAIEKLSGAYFKKCKTSRASSLATNDALADKLWDLSEQLLKNRSVG